MKPLFVCIAIADVPNLNHRVYPRAELERAILNINQDSVTRGRVFGQFGMPQGTNIDAVEKISHIAGNFYILDDGSVMAEIAWLPNAAGEAAKKIYETTPTAKFRPAGNGKTRVVNGVTEIFDYRILSINLVLDGA